MWAYDCRLLSSRTLPRTLIRERTNQRFLILSALRGQLRLSKRIDPIVIFIIKICIHCTWRRLFRNRWLLWQGLFGRFWWNLLSCLFLSTALVFIDSHWCIFIEPTLLRVLGKVWIASACLLFPDCWAADGRGAWTSILDQPKAWWVYFLIIVGWSEAWRGWLDQWIHFWRFFASLLFIIPFGR